MNVRRLFPSHRSNLLAIVVAIVVVGGASLAVAPQVKAQAGAGSERYEVTITPPKRPGSEAATAPDSPAPADVPAADDPNAVLGTEPTSPSGGSANGANPAAPAVTAKAAATRPPTNLPLHALQVGAFRESKRATSLRDELTGSFPDVAITEAQSGGQAIYRVNVARLPHGAELEAIRLRLVAAGFPAFEVAAPSAPAAN